MISCPFEYDLTGDELKKLGEMSLTWSHTEHIIGLCLKELLKFSDDEAIAIVFQLPLENKLRYLRTFHARMDSIAMEVLKEFEFIMRGIQPLRNSIIHVILIDDTKDGILFHNRSKDRTFLKADVFACEEITNYAAHLAHALFHAIRLPTSLGWRTSWPEKPAIPGWPRGVLPHH